MVGFRAISDLNEQTIWERRETLRNRPDVQFVTPEEFSDLAVSCQRITRADESAAGLKGLFDQEKKLFYYVEEELLTIYLESTSSSHDLEMV